MKTKLIIGLFIISVFILTACAQSQTKYVCSDGTSVSAPNLCPKQQQSSCGDGKCDTNEDCRTCLTDCGECPRKYKDFTVNAYSDRITTRFTDILPLETPSYETTINLNKFDITNGIYRSSWLALYTDYDIESIRCEVKEYYDGRLNNQFTLDLIYLKRGLLGQSISIGYEENIKPSQARYDYTCKGTESDKQFSSSYMVYLKYE